MSIAEKIMAEPGLYSIQELQSAVENGLIPAFIGAPLIAEKTKEQQQAQMFAAAQNAPQPGQPTVFDQIMQQANQAQGLTGLQSNLPPQGYAPGGIVAFDEGGDVRHFATGDAVEEDEDDKEYDTTPTGLLSLLRKSITGAAVKPDLAASVEAIRGLRAPTDDTATNAIKDYIAKQAETAPQRAQEQRGWRALQMAGLMAGGKSQYGMQNLGEALAQTAPGFAQDAQAQEKERLQNLMLQSQLEQQRRAAESADITGGISLYGHEVDLTGRQASAMAKLGAAAAKLGQPAKTTDFGMAIQNNFDRFKTEIDLGLRKPPTDKNGNPLTGDQLDKVLRGQATDEAAKALKQFGPMMALQGTLAGNRSREDIALLNHVRDTEKLINDYKTNDKELQRAYRDASVLSAVPKPTEAQKSLLDQHKKRITEFEDWAENARARANAGLQNTPFKSTLGTEAPAKVEPKSNVGKQPAAAPATKPRVSYGGKTYEFATQEQADAFKKAVGQ